MIQILLTSLLLTVAQASAPLDDENGASAKGPAAVEAASPDAKDAKAADEGEPAANGEAAANEQEGSIVSPRANCFGQCLKS